MKKSDRVFGLHAVTSLLQRDPARVTLLRILESRDDARIRQVLKLAETARMSLRDVTDERQDLLFRRGIDDGLRSRIHDPVGQLGIDDCCDARVPVQPAKSHTTRWYVSKKQGP